MKKTTQAQNLLPGFKYRLKIRPPQWLATFSLLVLLLATGVGFAQTTRYVSTSGSNSNSGSQGNPYLTISYAITQSSSGDSIVVGSGTYTENLSINKSLVIRGANAGITGNGTRGTESEISNSNISTSGTNTVVFDGFDIHRTDASTTPAFSIGGSTSTTLKNCIIRREGSVTGTSVYGISIDIGATASIRIKNNLFTGDNSNLFGTHKTWNSAIYSNGGSDIAITDNEFKNCRTAINSDNHSGGVVIDDNTFGVNGTAISFGGSTPTNGNYSMSGNKFNVTYTIFNLSNVNSAFRLDARSNTYDGVNGNNLSLAQAFAVEARIYHKGRINSSVARNGLVTFKSKNLYAVNTLTTLANNVLYATAGDTISATAGTYTETLSINKSLVLRGANAGIAGNGTRGTETEILNGNIATSGSTSVVLDGFYIHRTDASTTTAVLLGSSSASTVKNCIIRRDGSATGTLVRGIEISAGSSVAMRITNNLITGDGSGGVFSGHKTWNSGIWSNGGSDIAITGNEFSNCRTAINSDDHVSGVSIDNNTFGANGTAISFGGTNPTNGSFTVSGNAFTVGNTIFNLSNVNSAFRLDARSNTYDGVSGNNLSLAEAISVEAGMYHKGRINNSIPRLGLVTFKSKNLYAVNTLTTLANNILYATAGDTISATAGTYAENLSINKSLVVRGANAGTAGYGSSRGSETKIAPSSGVPVTITADDVVVDGVEITAPNAPYAISNTPGKSRLGIVNNYIHDIGSSYAAGNVHAVMYQLGSADASDLSIGKNRIESVSNNSSSYSVSAIGILQSTSTYNLTGIQISENSINDISSLKGAYGIIINLGSTGGGKASDAVIENNLIGDIEGAAWANGISLDGNTPDAEVQYNAINGVKGSNITINSVDYNVSAGINIETNADASSVSISSNSISNIGDVSNQKYGAVISNKTSGSISAECNWLGTASYNSIFVYGNVDYTPWLTSGQDNNTGSFGFQPGSNICNGTPVVLSATSNNNTCFGSNAGSVDLTVSGGTSPYTYAWSNNNTTEDLSGLAAGTYTVTVTDANLSSTVTSVVITQPDELSATVNVTDNTCFGETIGAIDITSVSGGLQNNVFEFSINGGSNWQTFDAGTAEFTGLSSGNYTMQIRQQNNEACFVEASYTIRPEIITFGASLVENTCFGQTNGSIDVINALGGFGTYQVSLDNSTWFSYSTSNTPEFVNLASGIYTIYVRDAANTGCVVNRVYTIRPEVLNSIVQVKDIACNSTAGGALKFVQNSGGYGTYEFQADLIGTTGVDYTWSSNNNLTGLAAGTYEVSIRDAVNTGCVVSLGTHEVKQLTQMTISNVTIEHVKCFGQKTGSITVEVIDGRAGYMEYRLGSGGKWTAIAFNGTTNTFALTGLAAGTYVINIRDAQYQTCTQTTTAIVTGPSSALNVNLSVVDNNGTAKVYMVNSTYTPYTYTIYKGFYNYYYTNVSGASAYNLKADVSGGTGPYTFEWTNTGNLQLISTGSATQTQRVVAEAAASYTINIKDGNGCLASKSQSFSLIDATCSSPSGNGSGTGVKVCTVSGKSRTEVCAYQSNVMSLSSGSNLLGSCPKGRSLDVDADAMAANVKVYPNPSNGNFFVELLDFTGTAEVEIFDATGKLIRSSSLNAGDANAKTEFNISDVSAGVYVVKVLMNGTLYTHKIQVMQ